MIANDLAEGALDESGPDEGSSLCIATDRQGLGPLPGAYVTMSPDEAVMFDGVYVNDPPPPTVMVCVVPVEVVAGQSKHH